MRVRECALIRHAPLNRMTLLAFIVLHPESEALTILSVNFHAISDDIASEDIMSTTKIVR